MMKRMVLAVLGTAAVVAPASWGAAPGIPARPEQIEFSELTFEPPSPEEFRRVLSNGVPVYLAPSDEFPLVTVVFTFKGGDYLEPGSKAGLADMTGAMLRRGGTTSIGAEDLDEQLDYLAATVSTGFGRTTGTATLNCLTSNFDEAMALFIDMLRNPAFDAEKTAVYRNETLESMKQRNDRRQVIMQIQASRLMWGPDHFEGRFPTKETLESITADDMRAFHQRVVHPGNLIIGVTGDFEEREMMSKLEAALSGWAKGEPVPDEEDTTRTLAPGLYYIDKDLPQGQVQVMHRGIKRDDPDAIALSVMNDILGGGGFTSRLVRRVRDDEGLAYGANSFFQSRVEFPGVFGAGFASKNRTVALATRIMMEEINKIRTGEVTDEELETSKNSFIETFPRNFESKAGMLQVFITDEWTNRPKDYWKTYRERVQALTKADIQRVAAEHLRPEEMAIVVVGKWEEIGPGDPTEQRPDFRANMAEFGEAKRLPMLDPLTLRPLPEQPRRD